jgi:hypothetical protein
MRLPLKINYEDWAATVSLREGTISVRKLFSEEEIPLSSGEELIMLRKCWNLEIWPLK